LNVKGKGYQKDALKISIQSNSTKNLKIVLKKGTIFQHTEWINKQNLCVSSRSLMNLEAKDKATFNVNAFCMNLMCGCCNLENMTLTDF